MNEIMYEKSADGKPRENAFLSILVILSGRLRILLLAPIFVALIAFCVSFVLPPTYESQSVLRFSSTAAMSMSDSKRISSYVDYSLSSEAVSAAINSPDFLLPLLPNASWLKQDESKSEALKLMRSVVSGGVNKRDGLFTIVTSGPSAIDAQNLHFAVIENLRALSKPKGNTLADIEMRRSAALATLRELDVVLPSLNKQLQVTGAVGEKSATVYGLLLESRLAATDTLRYLESSLKSFGDEAFVQMPSLPDKAAKPNKVLIALAAYLFSLVILLAFVFTSHAVRAAEQRPMEARQLQSIRENWRKNFGML